MPQKMWRYIFDSSGLHQVGILGLTVAVFLIEVVPLELQRRIVNDAVKHRQFYFIVTLCAVYAGVCVVHGGLKLCLNLYRAWIAQRATRDLRKRIRGLAVTEVVAVTDVLTVTDVESGGVAQERGIEIEMIVNESDPIGSFVAEAVSEPLLQGGILASVGAYMIHVDPIMSLMIGVLFVPQFIFVPMMQGAINRRTKGTISLLRLLSSSMTDLTGGGPDRVRQDDERITRVFTLYMGVFELKFTMNFLMNLCTHLQVVAALLYGGWLVLHSELEIGGVVAVISGISRLTDPWGDLVNYFRDVSLTNVKYRLLADTANQIATRHTTAPSPR
jgi:ABC-type multidrug transport system fused ATPase/permease subunit